MLTGWGVPGSIARILAGAIIGALAAIAAMSQSGCTATLDVYPDGGRWRLSGQAAAVLHPAIRTSCPTNSLKKPFLHWKGFFLGGVFRFLLLFGAKGAA